MSGKDRYRKLSSAFAGRKEDKPQVFSGTLGITTNSENQVEVPGRPGFVWVQLRNQLNETIQAFNEDVSPVFGLPVLVEWDKDSPTRYKIRGRDTGRYTVWTTTNAAGDTVSDTSAYLPAHGSSHSFNKYTGVGGGDVAWIYSDQFMPWAVTPSGSAGSLSVAVQPSAYYYDQQFRWAGGTGIAGLDVLRPTGTSNARMILVYLDPDTGNPYLATGTLTEFANTITGTQQIMPYMPSLVEETDIPLAGIRLITGTNKILWQNLYDLRDYFAHSSTSGSSGGGGAPTDAQYVVMALNGDLSAERVLTAGDDIVVTDGGAGGNATVGIITGSFSRPGHSHTETNTILGYDDSVFKATGTAISFDDNLTVHVTGSIIYVDGQAGGGGGSGNLVIYDDSVYKVTGSSISFDENLDIHVTGSTVFVKSYDSAIPDLSLEKTITLITGTTVTIVDDSNNNSFPGLTKMANGNLIVVYRQGTTHSDDKGTILMRTSSDRGSTWSSGTVVYSDGALDVRDPEILRTDTDRLVINFAKYNHTGTANVLDGAYTTYSDDNGGSWSSPQQIDSFFTSWSRSGAGPSVSLPNGDLLLTLYGQNSGDTYDSSSIVKSTDDGATWHSEVLISDGENDSSYYNEPNLLRTLSGKLVCLMRSDTPNASSGTFYRSISYDDGETWTDVSSVVNGTGKPSITQLSNGLILLVYRRRTDKKAVYRISRTEGLTWEDETDLDASTMDKMSYASSYEYDNGIIGTAYGKEIADGNADLLFKRFYVDFRSTHIIEDDGIRQAPRSKLNFVGNNFVLYDDETNDATIISGTASGSDGAGTADLIIYDNNVFQVTGTALDFGDYLNVAVTGSIAYISSPFSPTGFDIGARVYNSTGTVVSNTTVTALEFDSEDYDTDGIHSGSSTQLYCNTAGKYVIIGQVWWEKSGSGVRNLYIQKNGTTVCQISENNPSASFSDQVNIATAIDLDIGDYIELAVYQDSGGDLDIRYLSDRTPYFMMHKIDGGGNAIQIYDDGVFKATGTVIDFGANLDVSVTGNSVWVDGQAGGGADLLIYDNGTFKVTGTSIDFEDGLTVDVTGSSAFVNSTFSTPVGVGAKAYNSTNIGVTGSTAQALTFDSELYDTDSIHSTASNTSRLTCQTAGKYLIIGTIEYAANSSGERLASIRLNGSTNLARNRDETSTVASAPTVLNVSEIYDLNVGDYVELVAYQTSGGTLNVNANGNISPFFSMQLIEVGDQDNTLQIYDDSVFVATGTAISFDEGLDVVSTGTTAYVGLQDIGARVYNSADQTLSNGVVETGTFNSERWDTDNIHDTATNNSRLTCNTAGKYLIKSLIRFDSSGTGQRQIRLRLNGSTLIAVTDQNALTTAQTNLECSTIYNLSAGDYVECLVYQNSGGDLDIKAVGNFANEFMMQRIA